MTKVEIDNISFKHRVFTYDRILKQTLTDRRVLFDDAIGNLTFGYTHPSATVVYGPMMDWKTSQDS